jgi:NAD(P)H dehydrogenase (quinone)
MKYIVTGVDGQLGGLVAKNMIETCPPQNLIFTAPKINRIPQHLLKSWLSKGVEVRSADYQNPTQLEQAFTGGKRLFMISSIINGPERVIQHKNVISAAKVSGIEHITYTSFLGANRPGYTQYVLPDHTQTETFLHNSGIPFNIMRNNLYLENYLTNAVMLANISNDRWCTNAGEGIATFISKQDSARVAAALLTGLGEPDADYDVTGEPVSQREICEYIATYSGRPYTYEVLSDEDYLRYLDQLHIPRTTDGDYSRSPVPYCSNDMVTNEKSISEGLMMIETDTVRKLTGKDPVNYRSLLPQYKSVWEKNPTNYWSMVKLLAD